MECWHSEDIGQQLQGTKQQIEDSPQQLHSINLTRLRSITSCSMKRIRDDVFFSLMIFSI